MNAYFKIMETESRHTAACHGVKCQYSQEKKHIKCQGSSHRVVKPQIGKLWLILMPQKSKKPMKVSISFQKVIRRRNYTVRFHIPLVKCHSFTYDRRKLPANMVQSNRCGQGLTGNNIYLKIAMVQHRT